MTRETGFWVGLAGVVIAGVMATRLGVNEYYFFAGYVVLQFVVIATAWNILGGYAGYVWPAYLITAAVLIANLLLPQIRHRRQRKSFAERGKNGPPAGG